MNAVRKKAGPHRALLSATQPNLLQSPGSRRGGALMLASNTSSLAVSSNDRVFPVAKIAVTARALSSEEGVSLEKALEGVGVSTEDLRSPTCRVSQFQILQAFRNAAHLANDPHFAIRLGLRFRASVYGIYGFALLSSVSFREAVRFALEYTELTSPLVRCTFAEEPGSGIWTITPLPVWGIDAALYQFLIELQFGAHVALHRDVMGKAFVPTALQVTYPRSEARSAALESEFGCPVLFEQKENRLVFDSKWLDGAPDLANELTFSALENLCDEFLSQLHSDIGDKGRVRRILLANLGRPSDLEGVARKIGTTPRTLRRRLREERTSFRQLSDEVRMQLAVEYLRETKLTNEEIASCLGFREVASFQRAFRRWTKVKPSDFRSRAGNLS